MYSHCKNVTANAVFFMKLVNTNHSPESFRGLITAIYCSQLTQ